MRSETKNKVPIPPRQAPSWKQQLSPHECVLNDLKKQDGLIPSILPCSIFFDLLGPPLSPGGMRVVPALAL